MLEFNVLVKGSFGAIVFAASRTIKLSGDFLSGSAVSFLPFRGFSPNVVPELLFGFFFILNNLLVNFEPLIVEFFHFLFNFFATLPDFSRLLEIQKIEVCGPVLVFQLLAIF
jgi:hypothetical protein